MTKPITREEACETVQKVVELLDTALDASEPCRAIGTAQGLLANVLAALSSCACGGREPIAVEKGHFYEDGGPGWCDLALENWVEIGPQDVDVLIFALPTEETGS